MKKVISIVMTFLLVITILPFGTAKATAISAPVAGIVSTAHGNLNVRAAQSTSSAVIASLPGGSYVTLLSRIGSWWYLEYADGKYGYSHADYLKTVSTTSATVQITYGTLNVRAGAGKSYSIIDSLRKGQKVVILSESNGWSKILYQGRRVGYVSNQYLKKQNTDAYGTVLLNVPSYKQTDSRWADVILGSSGKTIRAIGCTTTALAMTESYRLGNTVYPDAMSERLRYSSDGSLYWPTNYHITTDKTDYLQQIYRVLQQGKPVILGAKTSAGKQHWVVVTGFEGGTYLSVERFRINDPGSAYRTSLAQFLNVYPHFYKLVY